LQTGLSQSCLPLGITFSTQAQIDSFQIKYPNCRHIQGPVVINGPDITNLNGLTSVASIGGFLDIASNNSLTDITGLINLKSINGYLQVGWNRALKSLTGLDSIEFDAITSLEIRQNDSLSNCSVQSICYYILTGKSLQIYSNTTGCNNAQEIFDRCHYDLGVETHNQNNDLSIYPCPASNFVTIETLPTLKPCQLSILNLNGQEIINCSISEQKTQIDISGLASGVYYVKLCNGKSVQMGKIVKQL